MAHTYNGILPFSLKRNEILCHNMNVPEDMMLRKKCQTQEDGYDGSTYKRYSEQANSLRQKVEPRLRRTEGCGGKGAIV